MSEEPVKAVAKRVRNAAATRSAILEAATRCFVAKGYEHAGTREIAAEAGVDGALVNRYFGSKEGLFAEVIAHAFDIRDLIAGDRSTLADRLARLLVYGGQDPSRDDRTPLMLLIRAATEPRAAALLRTNLDAHNLQILSERIGGADAPARAAIVAALLTGFTLFNQMIKPQALAEADQERLVGYLRKALDIFIQ